MKICIDCKQSKDESQYGAHKSTADKLTQRCKACTSVYNKNYREKNAERIREKDRAYALAHAEEANRRARQWIEDNPDRRKQLLRDNYQRHKLAGTLDQYYGNIDKERNRQRSAMWRRMNPGRVNAQIAKRRADTLQATPSWAEYEQIVHLYNEARRLTEETGIEHQVDHIIPLNSPLVCGLHCLSNLQVLTAEENNKKKCKFDSET